MDDNKKTQITISSDKATGIASTVFSANINAIGYNIDFLVRKQPTEAVALIRQYGELSKLTVDSPDAPEEDIALAAEQIKDMLKDL